MTKVDYQKWLCRKTWEVTQAIPLLFGVNPEFVEMHIGKQGRTEYYVSNIIEGDLYNYYEVRLDHINEMFAQYDFELGLKECEIIAHTDFDISTPSDWLDWFCGYGIKPNSELVDAAKLVGWQPAIDQTSIVVRYYKYWAKKEAWSFHDAIALLSRTKPQEFDSLPVILPDCAYSGERRLSHRQSEELIYSIASQSIRFVEVDRHSHIERRFAPTDIIEWAESKGYYFPNLLIEALGYKQCNLSKKRTGKGMSDRIIAEFNNRVVSKTLASTWQSEIKALRSFAEQNGHPYQLESMKNIIKEKDYNQGKRGIQKRQ